MTKLLEQFLAWLRAQLGGIYAWGAQGEDVGAMTEAAFLAWLRRRENGDEKQIARVLKLFNAKKAAGQSPILAYDCSGLIVHWISDLMKLTSGDMTADTLYKKFGTGGLIKTTLQPGDLVFIQSKGKMVHVGVYVGDGQTIEAYGRDRGVVQLPLASGEWTHMGRLPFFVEDKPVEPISPAWVVSRVLKLPPKKNDALLRGDDVRELQKRLLTYGIKKVAVDGKMQTLIADGVFGPISAAAVEAYQKAVKLTVDGKAGKITITKLGGIWRE